MILVTDIEGIILYVNDFYLKHFNFKSENVVGKLYTTQIFLGDNERILEAIKKCIENPQNSEKIIIRKPKKHNKTYYYSSWEFFAIVNDLKEPIGILSIGYDISDSFILDDPEIDEFYSLVNNMTAESWTFYDTDLHLRTCNQKAIEIAKNVFNVEPIKGDHAMMYVLEEHKPIM
ncbi:hypothetical protein JCM31826_02350 [Thermaurantimonas aggregans]|nr:PAS domain-containing protein [Thermaurantimonas aggregans]GCD76753.1 hypothetical protein JCM31826_02350 [Thermaurantimonas aggregans]